MDPDFVVTELEAPTSFTDWSSFQARARVCNVGGSGASAGETRLVFSQDAVADTMDFVAATGWATYLSPGQCDWVELWGAAPGSPPNAWYLIAQADASDFVLEGDETNNSLALGPLGVGYGPDLVVKALSTPAVADSAFQASFQICNLGTDYAPGSDVTFYASTDTSIETSSSPTPDFMLGTSWVSSLSPGECRTEQASLWAGPWGEYFIGAVVDELGMQAELVTSNNTFVGGVMGFGYGPDLVVSAIDAPPSANGAFEAQVTVCNQGNGYASGSDVNLYASADEVLDLPPAPSPDFFLGSAPVQYLNPGECRAETAYLSAAPQGALHVIGVVDQFGGVPELIESNNVFLGELMGFGFGPDLVVTAISAPPSAQSSFDASVTACNQGTDYAGSFDVVLYVSEDDVITTAFPGPSPDFPAAWANFPGLAPGQCQTQAVQANAWGQGAFYLGAVVDESQSMPELIEGNNTFVGGLIGLGNGPDLIVTAVEGPPTADGSFDVQVTTCNQGTDFASGGSVTVYLSVDDVITPPVMPGPYTDFPAAWVPLPGLMPGQCSTDVGTVYGFAWGAYYLGAVADENDTVPELIESNNTFVGEQIGLGSGPDLIVTAVDGPPSADGSFTVQVTACNQGTAPSGSSEVAVYASADQVITSAWSNPYYVDFPVGFMPLPGLSPGQCYSGAVSAWAPPQGAYYLGAYVDESDSQQELLEGNNTFVGALTGFGYGPDLVVTQITAPANADGAFDLTVVACNQGTGPSGGFPVELYVSEDRVIDPYTGYGPPVDFPLAGLYFAGLQPGECASQTTSAWAPVSGEWYLGAYADPQDAEAELIESNNAFIGPRMGFGFGPDLIVTQITAPPSADGQFSLSVRVCNQGTAFAPGADVAVYATEDTTIDTNFPPPIGDFMLTTLPVPGLQPGECQDLTDMAYSGPSGAFYLGAIVDQFQNLQELQEGNNTFVGDLMGFGPGPDMVVSEILAPPSANGPFVATLTVCNQGTTPSFGIDVTLYASEDSVVTPQFNLPYPSPDMFLGQAPVPPLNPGECAGVGVNAYSAGQGAYYLGAVVDEFQGMQELIESNNTLVAGPIGFGFGPDLVAGTIALPPFAMPGAPLTIDVEVCNQGTDMSPAVDAVLVASVDDHLVVDPPSQDFMIGPVWVPSLAPGACTLASVSGPAPWQLGAYAVGLVVDPFGTVQELIESNNAEVAGTLEVANEFCGNGLIESQEWCDDGNFESNDGCNSLCQVEERPWQLTATGTERLNIGWNYAMGYNFVPMADGAITALGGVFNGTKTVRLFNRSSGVLLAETQVTGNNDWTYGAIAPVPVVAGQQYTVAVYLAGSGGSYRTGVGAYPKYAQDIQIIGSTYRSTSSNPSIRPTNNYTGSIMYGQADVMFVRSDP